MTKAQKILNLYDGKRSTKEIAKIIGCRPEYVRVVARQRMGSSMSDHDRRYWNSERGQKVKAALNDKWADVRNGYIAEYNRVLRKTGDIEKARRAGRLGYKRAKQ